MTQGTTDSRQGDAARSAQDWQELNKTAPRPATGTDRQSVPEGPPSRSSSSRILGPGSLAGTLCADPELRFTGTGKALCKLRVAVAERGRDPDTGRWVDGPTEFVDVTVWGRQGENVTESLRKGDRVVVNGLWQEDGWTGRDGQWHTRKTLAGRDVGPSLMFRQARIVRNEEGS